MAQECMSIFEKNKLPAVASVEQVGAFHLSTKVNQSVDIYLGLRHRCYRRRKGSETFSRRNGSTAG